MTNKKLSLNDEQKIELELLGTQILYLSHESWLLRFSLEVAVAREELRAPLGLQAVVLSEHTSAFAAHRRSPRPRAQCALEVSAEAHVRHLPEHWRRCRCRSGRRAARGLVRAAAKPVELVEFGEQLEPVVVGEAHVEHARQQRAQVCLANVSGARLVGCRARVLQLVPVRQLCTWG